MASLKEKGNKQKTNNKKTKKNKKLAKKYNICDKHTLLLILDCQEKYRKFFTPEILINIKKLVDSFNKKKYPVAWTRYARCMDKSRCIGDTISPLSIVSTQNIKWYIKDVELKEMTVYNHGQPKWNILKEFTPNKEDIYDYNFWNPFHNDKFNRMLVEKQIKKIIIVGGWTTYCVISTSHTCLNHDLLPIIITDGIFDGRKQDKCDREYLGHSALLYKTSDIELT